MTVDTLFNTSWQVLLGVAAVWWVVFAGLLLHQRSSAARHIHERLKKLVSPDVTPAAAANAAEQWMKNLGSVNLILSINPSKELRLIAFKWFLGGLLGTGQILLISALLLFGSDTPSIEATRAGRFLSIVCLTTSGFIFATTLIVGITFEAPRAVLELARPYSDQDQ